MMPIRYRLKDPVEIRVHPTNPQLCQANIGGWVDIPLKQSVLLFDKVVTPDADILEAHIKLMLAVSHVKRVTHRFVEDALTLTAHTDDDYTHFDQIESLVSIEYQLLDACPGLLVDLEIVYDQPTG